MVDDHGWLLLDDDRWLLLNDDIVGWSVVVIVVHVGPGGAAIAAQAR